MAIPYNLSNQIHSEISVVYTSAYDNKIIKPIESPWGSIGKTNEPWSDTEYTDEEFVKSCKNTMDKVYDNRCEIRSAISMDFLYKPDGGNIIYTYAGNYGNYDSYFVKLKQKLDVPEWCDIYANGSTCIIPSDIVFFPPLTVGENFFFLHSNKETYEGKDVSALYDIITKEGTTIRYGWIPETNIRCFFVEVTGINLETALMKALSNKYHNISGAAGSLVEIEINNKKYLFFVFFASGISGTRITEMWNKIANKVKENTSPTAIDKFEKSTSIPINDIDNIANIYVQTSNKECFNINYFEKDKINKWKSAIKNIENKNTLSISREYKKLLNAFDIYVNMMNNASTKDSIIHYMKAEFITLPYAYTSLWGLYNSELENSKDNCLMEPAGFLHVLNSSIRSIDIKESDNTEDMFVDIIFTFKFTNYKNKVAFVLNKLCNAEIEDKDIKYDGWDTTIQKMKNTIYDKISCLNTLGITEKDKSHFNLAFYYYHNKHAYGLSIGIDAIKIMGTSNNSCIKADNIAGTKSMLVRFILSKSANTELFKLI